MARKFGKMNVIKVDPLAYNLGLLGEGGIGKTTLAKEVCEILVGKNGYLILNIGKEDGIDAIAGAMYEDIPDWDTLDEFLDDIIENREEYTDLKVLVWDSLDELLKIGENEILRKSNKKARQGTGKVSDTINGAAGGFGSGQDLTIDAVLDKIWLLKKMGISMFLIGHTKQRTKVDISSGMEYDILTTDVTQKYFNKIKNKLHILGVGSIDRDIIKTKTGRKDIKGKDIIKGDIKSETRKITFRDEGYNIDSKSRFSNIVGEIPFDPHEFIKAITDAIKFERDKEAGDISEEDALKTEEKAKDKKAKEALKVERSKKDVENLAKLVKVIDAFVKNTKIKAAFPDKHRAVLVKLKEFKAKPMEITDIKQAMVIVKIIKAK